jgi:hypothetical protein
MSAEPINLELDRDIDASRQVQPGQRVYGLRCRFQDVNQALMGPDLEMFTRVFVHVGTSNHAKSADVGRQRYRSGDSRPSPFGRFHNLPGGKVQHFMVERFQYNPYFLPSYHMPTFRSSLLLFCAN